MLKLLSPSVVQCTKIKMKSIHLTPKLLSLDEIVKEEETIVT